MNDNEKCWAEIHWPQGMTVKEKLKNEDATIRLTELIYQTEQFVDGLYQAVNLPKNPIDMLALPFFWAEVIINDLYKDKSGNKEEMREEILRAIRERKTTVVSTPDVLYALASAGTDWMKMMYLSVEESKGRLSHDGNNVNKTI